MEAVAGARASPWLNDFFAEDPATLGQVVGGERIGAKGAQRLLSVARNENTARKYERRLMKWFQFCEVGHGGRPYDPDSWTVSKWWLFAGWMLDPANNRDKDLNTVRSALNRYFEDIGKPRVVLGHTVRTIIKKFTFQMETQQRDRGERVGLNRIPCDSGVFLKVLELAEGAVGLRLKQTTSQLLQLLGWFRADTLRGFQQGDVYFDEQGWLHLIVRQVKQQPERKLFPAHLQIPPGETASHIRSRVLAALHRAFNLEPTWYLYIPALLEDVSRTDGTAANILTDELRAMLTGHFPASRLAEISSHSWREMAAVSTSRAGGCLFKMSTRGLWKRVDTMIANYIEPYGYFPFVPLLAELYDDLQPGARFQRGIMARSDGRGPTVPPHGTSAA